MILAFNCEGIVKERFCAVGTSKESSQCAYQELATLMLQQYKEKQLFLKNAKAPTECQSYKGR